MVGTVSDAVRTESDVVGRYCVECGSCCVG